MSKWHIYQKEAGQPHDDIVAKNRLPDPPAWRDFTQRRDRQTRGKNYKPSDEEVEMVNAALFLRRPLLITGNPGSGKSSLAYSVAWQLNLGPVLWWPINSRSTLQDGLYNYDALGRLRDLNIEKIESDRPSARNAKKKKQSTQSSKTDEMGRYIRLGPLGTALYGGDRPRVLLIDEIDKSDIDLPNDLLHVLEEGSFNIPELQRLTPDESRECVEGLDAKNEERSISVKIYPHEENKRSKMVSIMDGRVDCNRFPIVILTSNGERELPPAFKRRCLRLDIEDPKGTRLRDIVTAHITEAAVEATILKDVEELISKFESRRDNEKYLLATDQLLNAIYLITRDKAASAGERERILTAVLRELGRK